MERLELRDGGAVPALGLGTWMSSKGDVGAAVRHALEAGYRHIDCASIYGNEKEVGDALRGALHDGVVTREELWVTSKLWCTAHREHEVIPALERTLRDLQLEFLDLYLVHWPVALRPDARPPLEAHDYLTLEEVPLEETWSGMRGAKERGLARHIGVSNYSAGRLRAHADLDDPPEVLQVELHPYLSQAELVSTARELNVVVTAYSPLGKGAAPSPEHRAGQPILLEDPVVLEAADALGCTPAQVLIAWALGRQTAVIPKSVRPERIEENLAAASIEIPTEIGARLDALDRGERYVDGTFWAREGSPYTVEELWGGEA